VLDELLELIDARGLDASERAQEVRDLQSSCRTAAGVD
jgi:hypothetical protein